MWKNKNSTLVLATQVVSMLLLHLIDQIIAFRNLVVIMMLLRIF
ncbi:unnamed protein product [Schistosoma curassoni]|uniref:Uncharacterized protein n=1 Tax=Schistosoma curassoni TaxID=6186 RepID=A0A183JLK5_9TREM|nr:unnamed protein product [Schistosoma curassoni]